MLDGALGLDRSVVDEVRCYCYWAQAHPGGRLDREGRDSCSTAPHLEAGSPDQVETNREEDIACHQKVRVLEQVPPLGPKRRPFVGDNNRIQPRSVDLGDLEEGRVERCQGVGEPKQAG